MSPALQSCLLRKIIFISAKWR